MTYKAEAGVRECINILPQCNRPHIDNSSFNKGSVQSIIYIRTLAMAASAATGISFRLSFALCSSALVSNNRTSADRIITASNI
jgi:hypothetical protein